MPEKDSYSSTVRGWLMADGHRFALAQVGPDFVFLRDPTPLPPMEAELRIEIDGDERRSRVFLPDGIGGGESRRVSFSKR